MAYYAALIPVVQLLDDIIHDHVQYPDFDFSKHHITKSLHEKFTLLQTSLDDYSSSSNNDEASDKLERRIRDVSYRVQDIIESPISKENETEKTHIVQRLIDKLIIHGKSSQRRPVDHEVIYHECLRRVEAEVDSILNELATIKESYIKVKDFAAGSSSKSRVDIGSAPAESTTMVGFDEDVMALKRQLCGGSSQLQTIPITGMGGIGKTTLARNIFADKLIVDHFDVRVWVTVSQDYRVEKMLRTILDSINAITQETIAGIHKPLINSKKVNRPNLESTGTVTKGSSRFTQMTVDIHKQLINRRYLIIVDDVWSKNVLDDIKRVSKDDYNGSRIIITTRLSDVAVYATTSGSRLHQMQSLNEEQSWHLFREKVFGQEEGCVCPPELEHPGKSIVRNCGGLPLAIVVIAGVLSKIKRTQTDWNKIASNVNSVVTMNEGHFSRIFSLSYNHLPHHLKPCYLYIGGFPEDHKIPVFQLIQLWMAEGFLSNNSSVLVEDSLSSFKRRRSLEEVGEEYLEELVKRNLILVIDKSKYNGKIEVCGIHDLLRDLCQQRIQNENFFHFTDKYGMLPKDRQNNVRRACLYSYYNSLHLRGKPVPDSTARSILCFGDYHNWNISLGRFKLLRVFDSLRSRNYSFPDKLLELCHLRYIALYIWANSRGEHIRISPSISQLENLQTLIVTLHADVYLVSLPTEIWKLAQLRHVVIDRFKMRQPPIYATGGTPGGGSGEVVVLENLQTLKTLINFRLTEEAVAMFPNLKILLVSYTERENGKWEYINNLSNLRQLEELEIELGYCEFEFHIDNNNRGFAFPPNLKKLCLSRCVIPWEKISNVVGCLPNLEVLELIYVNNMIGSSEWEPEQGEFQSLKYLLIDSSYLEYWRVDDTHFPRLVQLQLRNCSRLEEIPMEIGDIPTLQFMEVTFCSNSAMESARLIQQQQEEIGNDMLQFKITH